MANANEAHVMDDAALRDFYGGSLKKLKTDYIIYWFRNGERNPFSFAKASRWKIPRSTLSLS